MTATATACIEHLNFTPDLPCVPEPTHKGEERPADYIAERTPPFQEIYGPGGGPICKQCFDWMNDFCSRRGMPIALTIVEVLK